MRVNRHFVFRHYWWIAVVGALVGVGLALALDTTDRATLIGSTIAAALGFCYFVLQQKLCEVRLFKELFTQFNKRYDRLNDRLAEIAETKGPLEGEDRHDVVDYFNLCAEEFLFYKQGYILSEVWGSWCRGMLFYLDDGPFRSVWEEEQESVGESYYGLTEKAIREGAALPA